MHLITLTTDFGTDSPYVAEMKGVIVSLASEVRIVDITHSVPPQNIRHGALVLEQVCRHYPPGTLHLVVVDPGVGTDRAMVYAEIGNQRFLAPDNGVLSLLARRDGVVRVVELAERRFWRSEVSSTFHGRDILAPVAAHLIRGEQPERLGPPRAKLIELAWPAATVGPGRIQGEVLACDTFGNSVTNIGADQLPANAACTVACRGVSTRELIRTYGERPSGTLVALVGSNGRLELAVVEGSAARQFQLAAGDAVEVTW